MWLRVLLALATVLCLACKPDESRDPRILELAHTAERAFESTAQGDSAALRRLVSNDDVYMTIWGINTPHPGLVDAAAKKLVPMEHGSWVEADTAYVVLEARRIRYPGRMEILFLRSGRAWHIHHVGLPES